MPKYFFDYYEDGEVFVDTEGMELADLPEVRLQAEDIASEIARDHLGAQPSGGVVEVRARNELGEVVCAKSIGIRVDGARMDKAFTQSNIRRAKAASPMISDRWEACVILYVEDEAIVAMAVIMAFEDAGFNVEHAVTGHAAVRFLDHRIGEVSALVTDVRLPELDGWSVARSARQLRPELPVVYVSGDSAADWAAQGVPGSVMLQKPCSSDDIVDRVKALLATSD
jgi:CheY-like chemotaxis protein